MVAFHGNYDKLNRTFYVIISDYYPVCQGRLNNNGSEVMNWAKAGAYGHGYPIQVISSLGWCGDQTSRTFHLFLLTIKYLWNIYS